MKKIMISLFAVALMVLGVGAVKAEDTPLGIEKYQTVACLDGDKDASMITKKNATTLCYIIGTLGTGDHGASAGFISQAYSGDGLKIIGAEPFVEGTKAIWINSGTNSSSSPAISTSDTNAPAGLKQSACPAAAFAANSKTDAATLKGIQSAGCGVFYTPTNESTYLFGKSGMTDSSEKIITKSMASTHVYVVVGAYKVQITAEEGEGCGQICTQTTEIENDTQWTCVVQKDGSYKTTDGKDCPNKTWKPAIGKVCQEVHYNITPEVTPEPPEDIPESGAFASYTILAAGALIAISAIAIAKKHNKISKV